MTILVLGATGSTGSVIVSQLKEMQADFSAMVATNEDAAKLNLKDESIRIGDFSDVSSLLSAFKDIQRVYLLTPIHPSATTWVKNVIQAAKEAGVKHIVKQSGLKASLDATSEVIRDHAHTDNLIKQSGLDYTLIQPNTFFQNFYGNLTSINSEGRFYSSLGDTALSLVDINDVAAVAVAALTESGHEGKTYHITGSEALTSSEHAKLLSAASGKEITYIDIPEVALVGALKEAGLGDWLSDKLGEMINWFTQSDYALTTNTVEEVTGRKPRTFADFAQELSHSIEGAKYD
ncbi:SDR family oxidoreductase [Vibrio alginolyticus]|uniref:SDR family oxidoreductase n=1 Tax=Vibrio alginolyticus TaxID=663 RepID=UPI001ED510D3|nr:SDR family oxidoreductase [Vibrio alginolyticus]EGR0722437.1 SDR family oxidoreductase [Vibrio alginolyticus]EJU9973550.1 SDR family oxidoreductase [Vibrio alginolyticus]MCR9535621.1 SDR family oxidoreductase [Vibrio alginolyticus]